MFENRYMVNAKDTYVDTNVFVNLAPRKLPISRWTMIPADEEYMNHLLNLFFTWDNIVERVLYQPIFEKDVARLDPNLANDDPGAFCSRFLINSLLAISCVCHPSSQAV